MVRYLGLLVVLVGVSAGEAWGQPDSLWSRTYGGGHCTSLIQTADGGFALAGTTISFGDGESDFWLMRTDENGDSLWSHNFGGEDIDGCTAIIQTADEGFAMGGTTYSFGSGGGDFWLLKTDENGDSLWSRTFGGEDDERCDALIQTADGGFALGGETTSFGARLNDVWLVKTDENGDSLWSSRFGGMLYDYCFSLVQTGDGGLALAGWTQSGASNTDLLLLRTDENGNRLWSRTYGGVDYDYCFALIRMEDNGFALGGFTESFGAGREDVYLVRTNDEGIATWSRSFGGSDNDVCYTLCETTGGAIALAGWTDSYGAGEEDFWLVKTSENGDSIWSQTFGGSEEERCRSMVRTADGGYALAGVTHSFGHWDGSTWLVKTGPDSVSSASSEQPIIPRELALFPAFPNPFNSSSAVSYQLSAISRVNLSVYDFSGRVVETLVNGYQAPGRHHLVWNARDVAAGEYFIRLSDQRGASVVKPIALVR
jgi:hypothetical protein